MMFNQFSAMDFSRNPQRMFRRGIGAGLRKRRMLMDGGDVDNTPSLLVLSLICRAAILRAETRRHPR